MFRGKNPRKSNGLAARFLGYVSLGVQIQYQPLMSVYIIFVRSQRSGNTRKLTFSVKFSTKNGHFDALVPLILNVSGLE